VVYCVLLLRQEEKAEAQEAEKVVLLSPRQRGYGLARKMRGRQVEKS